MAPPILSTHPRHCMASRKGPLLLPFPTAQVTRTGILTRLVKLCSTGQHRKYLKNRSRQLLVITNFLSLLPGYLLSSYEVSMYYWVQGLRDKLNPQQWDLLRPVYLSSPIHFPFVPLRNAVLSFSNLLPVLSEELDIFFSRKVLNFLMLITAFDHKCVE